MTYILDSNLEKTSIDIYSKLLEDRIIYLTGEILETSANNIIVQLLYLDSINHNPIHLYINSEGGDCYSGLAIIDTMNYIKSPIYTYTIGMACSMAYIIAVCGEKGHRYSTPHSRFMQHQPSGGIRGQSSDIEIYSVEMMNIREDMYNIMAKHTSNSVERIKKDCERDYWMKSNVAKEYGAVDIILESKR